MSVREALLKPGLDRSDEEIATVCNYLSKLKALPPTTAVYTREIAQAARLEVREPNDIVFYAEDLCTCWYIILSGSVYCGDRVYLPGNSFGRNQLPGCRRGDDCVVIDRSELIVMLDPGIGRSDSNDSVLDSNSLHQSHESINSISTLSGTCDRKLRLYKNSIGQSSSSLFDITMLPESAVDSDDDIDTQSNSTEGLTTVDATKESLLKEPEARNEHDHQILLDFVGNLSAFQQLNDEVRLELCKVMILAIVSQSGTVIIDDGEKMDCWSVLINGSVEVVRPGQEPIILQLGDSYGVKPSPLDQIHVGKMISLTDDCQFICISQPEYFRIMNSIQVLTEDIEENGQVVMTVEHRMMDNKRGSTFIVRGLPEKLVDYLIKDHRLNDPSYPDDFLITYRVFCDDPTLIIKRLLQWSRDNLLVERVVHIVSSWLCNHPDDFVHHVELYDAVTMLMDQLEQQKLQVLLCMLQNACSKSLPRTVEVRRLNKDHMLDFYICGGKDRGCGIYIYRFDPNSKAYQAGARVGDHVLRVNGTVVDELTGAKALDLLMSKATIIMEVRMDPNGFKQAQRATSGSQDSNRSKLVEKSNKDKDPKPHYNATAGQSLVKTLRRNLLFRISEKDDPPPGPKLSTMPVLRDHSRPSLDTLRGGDDSQPDHFEAVRVYNVHHQPKFFIMDKGMVVSDLVKMAVDQFGLPSSEFTSGYQLYETSVSTLQGQSVKSRCLPAWLKDVAHLVSFSSRLYLKKSVAEAVLSEEMIQEMAKEGEINLLDMLPQQVAKELTLHDFESFRQIQSTEYIYEVFGSKSSQIIPKNLQTFSELSNKEMFWVCSEVLKERNVVKRSQLLKRFILIAKYCKDFRNYNSFFAIVSGLEHISITRLRTTWERVPAKYIKILESLKWYLDLTRNMSRFRDLVANNPKASPLIPLFPMVMKDITFIHLGNKTHSGDLVNFEKMRMISKVLKTVRRYTMYEYDPKNMDQLVNQNSTDAGSSISLISTSSSSTHSNNRGKRTAQLVNNPKRCYDEFMTTRKIKSYIKNLDQITTNEEEFKAMSRECEPPPAPAPRRKNSNSSDGSLILLEKRPPTTSVESEVPNRSSSPSRCLESRGTAPAPVVPVVGDTIKVAANARNHVSMV